ncbi:hypothetical protein [Pedobacter sp. L105]|uniref:hypothetical protein n=1 Tax=Pedobacter sp. L105 TaxID=1641871 RepID=UPI001C204E67|nr:hypothetical protein [Pedobacter sp. L105]
MRKIMAYIKLTLLTFAFSLLLLSAKAQVIQQVQAGFSTYNHRTIEEKIFVHTDKDKYLPGEVLWFKAYAVDENDHKPLNLSKVLYVDILDEHQNAVIQTKVSLKNGMGSGSVYIPVTVINGNYQFRAYTNWMKNFSPDAYFVKKITLINPLKSPDAPVKESTAAFHIQFFPEGGNLVNGITSKVAFKATGQNGSGVAVTGAIVNQRNDTVARFNALRFGMGSFIFTPAPNTVYKAVVRMGSTKIIQDLPEVSQQGYVMKLEDNGSGQLNVTVTSAGNKEGNVYLFAHTRQAIKAARSETLVNGMAHFTISKNSLGEGISQFTVFDEAKQPVCERLYFKKPVQQLLIAANTDQQEYNLRKKVNVRVMAKDLAGKAADAELSMAVYRVDSLQSLDPGNIFNYLWLSSELKGIVESPEYYFKNSGADVNEALDNLMLTQGWRRFNWANILANKPVSFTYLPEYTGHLITAKIVNIVTNLPAKNILTYLGVPGKRVQLYTSKSDSSGNLLYNTRDFYGPNEIIVQTNSLIDSTYRIEVLSPFSDQHSSAELPKFSISQGQLTAIQEHSLGVQVMNIYSGNHIRKFSDQVVDSTAFYGKPSSVYKLDDFTRFTTMEEDLREYVKEDNIVKTKGKFHIKVLSGVGFLFGDPLVLLDGIPVFSMDKVMTVDPLKVKKLEVMPFSYYYGPSAEQGVFSFTTYKGDLGGVELDPHAVVLDYEGLQLNREFYSPVYDTAAQAASRIPDFRNLLYWSPEINTEDAVSFYTSDRAGKYVGVIQGITANGDAGSEYFTFEVR